MQKDKKQITITNNCDEPSFWINQKEQKQDEYEFWSSMDLGQDYEDYVNSKEDSE